MKPLPFFPLRHRQIEPGTDTEALAESSKRPHRFLLIVRSSAVVGALATLFALDAPSVKPGLSPQAEAVLPPSASGAAGSSLKGNRTDVGDRLLPTSSASGTTPLADEFAHIAENENSLTVRNGKIIHSLRHTLKDESLPPSVADQILKIFDPTLSPNAKPGKEDHYKVLYDRGQHGRSPHVLAVDMTYNGKKHQVAWFPNADGKTGKYYSFEGLPVPASRFATPVKYTRISSRFGPRIHPVRGEHHGHSGVDFAAPAGTPVVAAADGTVRFVGNGTGYGKYVAVSHRDGYTTYYGHLSRFAPQLRAGLRVKQGDTVGEVGSTGTATGPHLHFELRANSRPTDPLAQMGTQYAGRLDGNAGKSFDERVSDIRLQFAQADGAYPVANAAEARDASSSRLL